MAMLPEVFNAEENEKMGFNTLPNGWYAAEISKSEIKANSKKTGHILVMIFKIIDHDEFKGRTIYKNLNIIHANQQAQEISRKELATICECCGIPAIEDTEELHEIPMGIKLKTTAETAQWPAKNEISAYCPYEDLDKKLAGESKKSASSSEDDDNPF